MRQVVQVRRAVKGPTHGRLTLGAWSVPVALGRGGIKANKFEGDGGTPRGRFALLRLWFRPDQRPRITCGLPMRAIRKTDGWCEDPADRRYNRPVVHPLDPATKAPAHEVMWRDDRLYDLVIEISHNARPRVARRGSAVFMHVARPGFSPTAGCVALAPAMMRHLARRLRRGAVIDIG